MLTTDFGTMALLDKKAYTALIRHDIDDQTFRILEDKCIILTGENTERVIELYRKRFHFLFNGASLHIIIPTLRCNQKCVYCHSPVAHSSDSKKDMSEETAQKTLEFIFQSPARSITIEFQGGDSLLNFNIFEFIVKKARALNQKYRKKIRFMLVTNLTLMDEKKMAWLVKEDIDICTSLDGPKEVHDANRRMENGARTYDDVVKWIRFAQKKYNKKIGALMVTTRQSLPYWMEIIDEYVKLGINLIQIKPLNRLGFAKQAWKRIGYTEQEFIDFWKKSVDYIEELNKKGIDINERTGEFIKKKLFTSIDPNSLDMRNPCGAVIGQLAYNYDGKIYSCDEGRCFDLFCLGDVKTNKYEDIFSSQETQNLISASITENLACDACVYKPFCGTCPVMSYASNNNLIPKLATNHNCIINKQMLDYIIEKAQMN